MILSYPKGESQLPLSQRVITAEQQLHHREGVLRARAGTLTDDVRNRLTSPTGLLVAAGFGYLIAEATSRRFEGRFQASAQPQPSAPPTAPAQPGDAEWLWHALTNLYLFARPFIATYIEERVRQHVHARAGQEQPDEAATPSP